MIYDCITMPVGLAQSYFMVQLLWAVKYCSLVMFVNIDHTIALM